MAAAATSKLRIREFDPATDRDAVEQMELVCDVGPATGNPSKKPQQQSSLFIDHMGDPLSRVRNFPLHLMLVAEFGDHEEMALVGTVRCCVKNVAIRTRQKQRQRQDCKRVAYILGLRVSPTHRRLGIATRLVEKAEEWCRHKAAEYAYMATDRANVASLNLFRNLSYLPFRSPSVLVQPVHAHHQPLPYSAAIVRIPPQLAASIYSHLFSTAEFFPDDFASVLSNPLTLGTFLAVPRATSVGVIASTTPTSLPSSFAIMSLWNTKEVYRMQVKGVSGLTRAVLGLARMADKRMPWMRIPSVPDVFSRPLGYYFMYGLHMEGKRGGELMRVLCRLAHNLAVDDGGCVAVVAELGKADPVRAVVPHWRRFSWDEDVWCMKRLGGEDGGEDDWMTSPPGSDVIFVDPREV